MTKQEIEKRLRTLKAQFYKRSDIGAAQLFADVFRREHRYNQTAKEWYSYRAGVWERDPEGLSARSDLKLLSDQLLRYATDLEMSEDERKSFVKFACRWLSSGYRNSLLNDARDLNFFNREDLDKNPYFVNCQNGVISIKDGKVKFLRHNPDYLLSKQAGVEYNAAADCPRWKQFIDEVTAQDSGKQLYLQKLAGLALVGELPECKFFIVYGSTTRNGKSVFCETLLSILGDYGATVNPETLALQKVDSRRASGDLARLAGVRFAVCSEVPQRLPLDSALIKRLTGGEKITARHLMEREFEFQPVCKILMNTNYLPSTSDSTVFSSGRISVIEFPRHFEKHEQDKKLKQKLLKEASGILNWMIEGYKAYLREGLEEPESIQRATADYESDSDRIKCFLDECLIPQRGKCVSVKDAYIVYSSWCENSGYQAKGKQGFVEALKQKRVFRDTGTIDGKTVKRVIVGYSDFIKIGSSFEELTAM